MKKYILLFYTIVILSSLFVSTIPVLACTYTIRAFVADGLGSVTESSQSVAYGGTATIHINPDAHYHIANIAVDGKSEAIANPFFIYNVKGNHNVAITFGIDTFTLSYSSGIGGSISGASSQTVDYGAGGTAVTAVPDSGYYFVNWNDGSTANPRTDADVTANISVQANFSASTFTITVTQTPHGTISPETTMVKYGSNLTFGLTPNTGYYVATLLVDGKETPPANSYTFNNIVADHTISASFATARVYNYVPPAGMPIIGTTPLVTTTNDSTLPEITAATPETTTTTTSNSSILETSHGEPQAVPSQINLAQSGTKIMFSENAPGTDLSTLTGIIIGIIGLALIVLLVILGKINFRL